MERTCGWHLVLIFSPGWVNRVRLFCGIKGAQQFLVISGHTMIEPC
jgi:hypothetical protein